MNLVGKCSLPHYLLWQGAGGDMGTHQWDSEQVQCGVTDTVEYCATTNLIITECE